MKDTHFTEVTPQDIGILEDAQNGLLVADMMSVVVAQRVWYLELEGYLIGLKITDAGRKILKSLADFRKSLGE